MTAPRAFGDCSERELIDHLELRAGWAGNHFPFCAAWFHLKFRTGSPQGFQNKNSIRRTRVDFRKDMTRGCHP
jgi:hypothetical protein